MAKRNPLYLQCFEAGETIIHTFLTETSEYVITNKKVYQREGLNFKVVSIDKISTIVYEPEQKKSAAILFVIMSCFLLLAFGLFINSMMSNEQLDIYFFISAVVGITLLIIALVRTCYKPQKNLTFMISEGKVRIRSNELNEEKVAYIIKMIFIAKRQIEFGAELPEGSFDKPIDKISL